PAAPVLAPADRLRTVETGPQQRFGMFIRTPRFPARDPVSNFLPGAFVDEVLQHKALALVLHPIHPVAAKTKELRVRQRSSEAREVLHPHLPLGLAEIVVQANANRHAATARRRDDFSGRPSFMATSG